MNATVKHRHALLLVLILFLGLTGCAVAPSILTLALPPAEAGRPYSCDILVNENATLPVVWDLVDAPEGMVLSEEGRIGRLVWEKPVAGRIPVSISVSSSAGGDTRPFELVVAPARAIPPKIKPVRIDAVNIGSMISVRLLTSAAIPPAGWIKVDGPVGLVVSPDGVLTWLPTALGEFECRVRASNQAGEDELSLSISVEVTPEYEKGRRIGELLARNDDNLLPGEAILFMRENPQPEKSLAYKFGFETVLGSERAKLMHAAASEGTDASFGTGKDIGQKLAAGKVSDADARAALKQSMLMGEAMLLAWQAGFVKGYDEGGSSVYRALIISLR